MPVDIFILSILALSGVILVIAEIFLITGLGICGIFGTLFIIASYYFSYLKFGMPGCMLTIAATVFLFLVLFLLLVRRKTMNSISLRTDIHSTVAGEGKLDIRPGDTGISISRLNPVGRVKVNGITMEGKSSGNYIEEGKKVRVIEVKPLQLLVEEENRII